MVSTALNQEAFVGNEIAEKGERKMMEPGQVSLIIGPETADELTH